eukprot:1158358-Pelagomonas_calceolata.AAC.7
MHKRIPFPGCSACVLTCAQKAAKKTGLPRRNGCQAPSNRANAAGGCRHHALSCAQNAAKYPEPLQLEAAGIAHAPVCKSHFCTRLALAAAFKQCLCTQCGSSRTFASNACVSSAYTSKQCMCRTCKCHEAQPS